MLILTDQIYYVDIHVMHRAASFISSQVILALYVTTTLEIKSIDIVMLFFFIKA